MFSIHLDTLALRLLQSTASLVSLSSDCFQAFVQRVCYIMLSSHNDDCLAFRSLATYCNMLFSTIMMCCSLLSLYVALYLLIFSFPHSALLSPFLLIPTLPTPSVLHLLSHFSCSRLFSLALLLNPNPNPMPISLATSPIMCHDFGELAVLSCPVHQFSNSIGLNDRCRANLVQYMLPML